MEQWVVCLRKEKRKMRLPAKAERWRLDMAALDDSGAADFVGNGVALTVRDSTGEKYAAAVSRFVTFLALRDYPFDLGAFIKFLSACRKQGAAASTLEGYRSAVVWAQRCSGFTPWGDNAMLIRALKGYAYQDKLRGYPRGAIDLGMLEELIKLYPQHANVYAAIFLCVLRAGQAEKFRGGDAHPTGSGAVSLTVRVDKRNKCGSTFEHTAVKEILAPDAKALILSLSRTVPHGELVFPGIDMAVLSEDIKRAALILRWPAHLLFDGVHCLRHGGAQMVKTFVSTVLARATSNCGMSTRTAAWYSRMNEARALAQNVIDHEGFEDDDAEEA